MSYVVGWSLFLAVAAIGALLMRRAGPPGGSREPSATCGTGECGCGGGAAAEPR